MVSARWARRTLGPWALSKRARGACSPAVPATCDGLVPAAVRARSPFMACTNRLMVRCTRRCATTATPAIRAILKGRTTTVCAIRATELPVLLNTARHTALACSPGPQAAAGPEEAFGDTGAWPIWAARAVNGKRKLWMGMVRAP